MIRMVMGSMVTTPHDFTNKSYAAMQICCPNRRIVHQFMTPLPEVILVLLIFDWLNVPKKKVAHSKEKCNDRKIRSFQSGILVGKFTPGYPAKLF